MNADEQTESVRGHKDLLQRAIHKEIDVRNMTVLEDCGETIAGIALYLTLFVSCALDRITVDLFSKRDNMILSSPSTCTVRFSNWLETFSLLKLPNIGNTLQ